MRRLVRPERRRVRARPRLLHAPQGRRRHDLGRGHADDRPALLRPAGGGVRRRRASPAAELTALHEDVAASLQAMLEEAYLHLVARALGADAGIPSLCLAGGVALNAVANGRILPETPFEERLRPARRRRLGHRGRRRVPRLAPGARAAARLRDGARLHGARSTPTPRCAAALAAAGLDGASGSTTTSSSRTSPSGSPHGDVVGWFQGRMEFGPRALGHRSIVADPRRPDMKDILNARIKHREPFRPFAPSILAGATGEWFEQDYPSPFMVLVYKTRADKRELIPAVNHVDDTGRLQTVDARGEPALLPADRGVRAADRRADPAQHVVQRERADRDDAASRRSRRSRRRGWTCSCSGTRSSRRSGGGAEEARGAGGARRAGRSPAVAARAGRRARSGSRPRAGRRATLPSTVSPTATRGERAARAATGRRPGTRGCEFSTIPQEEREVGGERSRSRRRSSRRAGSGATFRPMLTTAATPRDDPVELGLARAADPDRDDRVAGVGGGGEGEQRDRVGRAVRSRAPRASRWTSHGASTPSATEIHAAEEQQVGEHVRVRPLRLAVVLDRVRERRPGEAERDHQEDDRRRDADGDRVDADLGLALVLRR